MGLHDRIHGSNGNGTAVAESDALAAQPQVREGAVDQKTTDPYAELKTRVHHACIAKLGPQLYATETNANLNEQVMRAVTEQLALDRTPLTREERRQLTREIADDILG